MTLIEAKGLKNLTRGVKLVIVCLLFVGLISACGVKSKEDVSSALNKKIEELKGYKVNAKMTIKTAEEPHVYEVEIWHKKPHYYRVLLKNDDRDQSQIILRNDDGVFVLTPALNKSFRFQSNWPQNSSQAYLYESLVQDILKDKEAKFEVGEKNYVFETKTNYQNNQMLPYQKIAFHKKNLTPSYVKVMDVDRNALVSVEFSNFESNPKFDKNAFEIEKTMSNAQVDIPVLAQSANKQFAVLYPLKEDLPEGVDLVQEKELNTDSGKRVVLTYGGEKSFTLIEELAEVSPVTSSEFVSGELVDLGFAVGALTDNSLTWTYNGVDYMLASNELTQEEMIAVARSVQSQSGK
ncbi:sporulation protein [Aeribacillus pallidus]|nr:sporulation protein [Aeribacillus pallidus]